MKKNRLLPLIFGCCLLALFLLMAAFPQLFTSYGVKEMFAPWAKPSAQHILGTNALGYDVFTEIVYGTRETLLIGLASSLLTMILGTAIGTVSAYHGQQAA